LSAGTWLWQGGGAAVALLCCSGLDCKAGLSPCTASLSPGLLQMQASTEIEERVEHTAKEEREEEIEDRREESLHTGQGRGERR
jgi:hypothetical protein